VRQVEADRDRLEGRLQEIDRELGQQSGYEQELKQAEAEAQAVAETLSKAEAEWISLEQSRQDLVRLQREIDELTRRIVEREQELKEGQQQLKDLVDRADRQAIEAALSEIRQQLSSLDPLQAKKAELEEARAEAAEQAASLSGINQALGPETEPIKERAQTLRAATDPTCPTCGQPLTDEHRQQLLAQLEQDIDSRRERYRQNRDQIQVLTARRAALDKDMAALDQQLNRRPTFEKRLGELEVSLTHAAEAAEQMVALNKKLERWREEVQQEAEKRQLLEGQAEQAEAELKAASLTQADLDGLRKRKRMADERVGGARQKLAALEQLEEQAERGRQERQRLAEEISLLEQLQEAFSKRGVPAMIIETVVPELERSANQLLTRMTNGRLHVRIKTQREIKSGELREALDIIISDELGSRPYELYSGGEAFRINFAIRIALSKLLANRAGAQLRSLFIDEGFGTQDEQGREQLVEAINSIQDDFDRILVITHIDELKDMFPTRIEVWKTPQGSQFSLS
jgi:exonuclease SbcC